MEGPDIPELVESVHNLLNALYAPLDAPSVVPSVPSVVPSVPSVVHSVPLVEPLVKDKPISFMATLLKKENIPFNRKVMHLYYKWDAPKKVNRYQRMCLFVEANRDALMKLSVKPMEPMVESIVEPDPRKDLMMSIFKKKNIEFHNNYMNDYYKWEKNAPRLNRYKKMCLFIEEVI